MNKIFKNGNMTCQVVSVHTRNMETLENIAIVRRLDKNKKTIDYVVVNNLELSNGMGEWGFSYGYDLSLTEASQLFKEKM